MKKRYLLVAAIVLTMIVLSGCSFLSLSNGDYYTQIDNTKRKENTSTGGVIHFDGSQPYHYTLRCYDENGDGKDLTFGASKELREGAFLHLTVIPIRGVTIWEEVQYDDLPEAVQSKYMAP